jgi:hypothetical protein
MTKAPVFPGSSGIWSLVCHVLDQLAISDFHLLQASRAAEIHGWGSWPKDDGNFQPLDKVKPLVYRIPQQ